MRDQGGSGMVIYSWDLSVKGRDLKGIQSWWNRSGQDSLCRSRLVEFGLECIKGCHLHFGWSRYVLWVVMCCRIRSKYGDRRSEMVGIGQG